MIAYAPGREAEVVSAIDANGGKGYIVRKSRGAAIEFNAGRP